MRTAGTRFRTGATRHRFVDFRIQPAQLATVPMESKLAPTAHARAPLERATRSPSLKCRRRSGNRARRSQNANRAFKTPHVHCEIEARLCSFATANFFLAIGHFYKLPRFAHQPHVDRTRHRRKHAATRSSRGRVKKPSFGRRIAPCDSAPQTPGNTGATSISRFQRGLQIA